MDKDSGLLDVSCWTLGFSRRSGGVAAINSPRRSSTPESGVVVSTAPSLAQGRQLINVGVHYERSLNYRMWRQRCPNEGFASEICF